MADPFTAALITAVPSVLGAVGAAQSQKQDALILESQAKQREQQAGQERAASQRQALEDKRQARILQSRAQARGAASGATGPGLFDIESDIIGEGELSALTSLYEGEERARSAEYGAELDRFSARQKRQQAKSTILTGLVGSAGKGYGSLRKSGVL